MAVAIIGRYMKIVGWVALLSFGVIALNSAVYLGYKLTLGGSFGVGEVAIAAFGLVAAWVCRVVYRTLIIDNKRP